jgi:hypothetical protein
MNKKLLQRIYDSLNDESLKEELKKEHPTVFQDQEYFDFGGNHVINTTSNNGVPLMIGFGLAPKDTLQYRCLVVNKDYELEIEQNNGHKILLFKKK